MVIKYVAVDVHRSFALFRDQRTGERASGNGIFVWLADLMILNNIYSFSYLSLHHLN